MNDSTFEEIEDQLNELKRLIASYPSKTTKEQQLQLNSLKKELAHYQDTYRQVIESHQPIVSHQNQLDW